MIKHEVLCLPELLGPPHLWWVVHLEVEIKTKN
jgi:hypothetical protein